MIDPFSNMAPGRFTNCTIPASFAVKKEKIYTNLKNEMMILEPLKKKLYLKMINVKLLLIFLVRQMGTST